MLAKQETEDAIKRTNDIEKANFDFRRRNKDIDREAAEQREREAEAEAKRKTELNKREQARSLRKNMIALDLKEMEVLFEDMPDLYNKIKQKLEDITPLANSNRA